MREVTGGFVTTTGMYFADKEKAEEFEIRRELEAASSRREGYTIWSLMDYLFKNFKLTRKI